MHQRIHKYPTKFLRCRMWADNPDRRHQTAAGFSDKWGTWREGKASTWKQTWERKRSPLQLSCLRFLLQFKWKSSWLWRKRPGSQSPRETGTKPRKTDCHDAQLWDQSGGHQRQVQQPAVVTGRRTSRKTDRQTDRQTIFCCSITCYWSLIDIIVLLFVGK